MKKAVSVFLVSVLLFSLVSFSKPKLVKAICCRKDNFDKSRYSLTGNMAEDAATIAKSQVDRSGDDFGYSGVDYAAWCDEYVADCLENAGCDSSIVAHGGTVADFYNKMTARGAVSVNDPKTGDLVFCKNASGGFAHVEIVTKTVNGVVYSAGGNNIKRGESSYREPGFCAGEHKMAGFSSYCYLRPNYKDSSSTQNMPGKPYFNGLQSYYESGEIITLQWNPTVNTTHYNIWINKYDEEAGKYVAKECICNAESGLTRSLSDGKYQLELQSYNSNYYFPDYSDWLYTETEAYILVGTAALPGKPYFNDLKPYYNSGETITLKWNPTVNTTHYNIWINKYDEEAGKYVAKEWICNAESGLTRSLSDGKYQLELQSYNSNYYYSDHSDWIHTVTDAYIIVCDSSAPRMWCEDINMPDEIPYGQPFSLSGMICSNNIVKWYALVIYNSNNKDIQNVNEAVWQVAIPNDYPITVAAEQLDFAALPVGNYRLSIQGMDKDNNYYGAYEKSFTVKCSQHSYVDTITPPTCTEQGYTTHTCSICGDSYIDSYVAASGHSYGAWIKLNDTQHQRVCSRDASHVETAPHTWNAGEVTTPATYDAAGEKTFTCTVCSATRTEVIDPIPQPADPDAVITVATVTAQPGKTVDVTVDLTEYAPMSYLLLGLDYNKTLLTLNSVKNGGLFDTLESGANLLLNAGSDIAAGGNLLTLTFTVSEDAEPGDYTVTVTCKQCYNNSEEPLLVKVENGKITVPDVIVGDVNDDEVIDGRDLIRLRKYLANLDEETGESTVEISAGADCTGDGIVDGRDLIRLRKYLANLDENTGISTVELG